MKIPDAVAYAITRAGSNMVVAKYAVMLENEGFIVMGSNPGIVDTSATSDIPRTSMSNHESL